MQAFLSMNNNKLILIVAISFSLLVNIPRLVFLFGSADGSGLWEVSTNDTLLRIISLFGFCFFILKLNIDWSIQWFQKNTFLKAVLLSFAILVVWIFIFRIFDVVINGNNSTTLNPRFNSFVYFFVMLMLIVISRTITLNNQAKIDAVEKEQLKQQSLQNELAALKNQVNPHFLFNSLNSLSLLVREDQNSAGKFIKKLSFLYRYILQSKDQDLVSLKEELKFLDSYLYLIKQRYRENFKAIINIDDALLQKKIPSLALQLLVENSVKHNEISVNKPLTVTIYSQDHFLIVKNKLQKRTGNVESTNTGLSNLNTRFKLLLNKEISIENNSDYFIVKLPII